MLKRTPLHEAHLKLGAKMIPFAGWEMPLSYKSILQEHNAVRNAVGLFDVGHMGLIKIEGEDALDLIQKTTTNDASKLSLHQCQYSILCNENGGTVDDILVYNLPMYYLIVTNAVNADKDLGWLKKYSKNYKHVTVTFYENYSILSLQGPKAEELTSKVLAAPLSSLKRNHTIWWKDIIISRTGYTGEDGFELMVAKRELEKIWNLFLDTGVQPCGLGARDTLRMEAGYPLYGHEYDQQTSPLEAGYGWAVKFDKGEFIGKEVLLKQKEKGLPKKLVGIEVEGGFIPRAGDLISEISPDNMGTKLAGKVTSGTFSPTFKKPLALAYLSSKESSASKQVYVEIRGKKIPAKIVAKMFYKR